MSGFIEIPASEKSLGQRKAIFGMGINDADYIVQPTINGKVHTHCPFYTKWYSMIKRCYSDVYHAGRPTYIGCSVSQEWLKFSNFKAWMMAQDWKGKSLDKDILVQGNKVYEPSKCLFVTNEINNLLNSNAATRGKYPQGVVLGNTKSAFRARYKVENKMKHIGTFKTPGEAHEAYKTFKYKHIAEVASQQSEPLRSALLAYKLEGDL